MVRAGARFAGLFLVGTLAGCTGSTEITRSPVALRVSSSVSQDRIVGRSSSIVRTYQVNADGKRQKISGASCDITSRGLSGRVTTPQEITYPQFIQAERFPNRGNPGPIKIRCKANGRTAAIKVDAVPDTPRNRSTTATSTSASGQTVSATARRITATHAQSYPWAYPGWIVVEFK